MQKIKILNSIIEETRDNENRTNVEGKMKYYDKTKRSRRNNKIN